MFSVGETLAVPVVDLALVFAGGLHFLFPAVIASLPFAVGLLSD